MADYVSVDALLSAAEDYDWISGLKTVLKRIPSVDAVEVVRCMDCENWKDINHGYCDVWKYYISNQDYFCGSGERGGDNG